MEARAKKFHETEKRSIEKGWKKKSDERMQHLSQQVVEAKTIAIINMLT